MSATRSYRFTITVTVDPGQAGFDDPEWIADAAWGSLTNEYGYTCAYGDIIETNASDAA